jgi:hypothetical protein
MSSPVTQVTDIPKAEAEAIDNNGGKAVQSIGTGARQLGPGLYITRGFQEWDHKDTSLWDCVVTVDAAYWNGLKKAWVPKSFVFPENTDTCRADGLWAFRFRECLPVQSPFPPSTERKQPFGFCLSFSCLLFSGEFKHTDT